MASRRLVPASVREALRGIPSDIASLERNYLLADEDLDLIGTRRRAENRLGLAIHIVLLRHPGQGWIDDTEPPAPVVAWLAEQIDVPFSALTRYGTREATRSSHRGLATQHLGLRAFVPTDDMRTAMDLAARAAFDTDDGRIILGSIKIRGVKRRNRPPSESRTGVRGRRLDVRASMSATLTPRILILPHVTALRASAVECAGCWLHLPAGGGLVEVVLPHTSRDIPTHQKPIYATAVGAEHRQLVARVWT